MTEITLGDRTMSLPDLSRLDLPRPDVSLPDQIREFSMPAFSMPEMALPDLRRRSPASPPVVPMLLVTLATGLILGIAIAAFAWSLAPVRKTTQRIRGRLSGPSWTNGPEPEFLENAIAGRPRDDDSPVSSRSLKRDETPVAATASVASTAPKAASPNGSTPAGRPVSPRSTVALDPGQS